ncbi:MAG TPA: ABC transporter permease [Ilumatobacter sp.]|nr:ABC transporter permease [Ilumatobacter sp.]
MFRLVMRRLLSMVPVLLLVLLLVMGLVELMRGDLAAVLGGEDAVPEQVAALKHRLGLDQSLPERFVGFLGNALTGDLGTSWLTGRAVWTSIRSALPVTLSLAFLAMLLAILIAVPVGILAAARPSPALDRFFTMGTSVVLAVPEFVVGLILVTYVSLKTGWFPATGYSSFGDGPLEWLQHLLLPAITLALPLAAQLTRQVRAAMISALAQDSIRTARAAGMSERTVVLNDASRLAALPVVTVIGLQISRAVGGAVIVEQVFAMPGYGSLAVDAVIKRDVPVLQGVVLVSAVMVLLTNTMVDLFNGYLNPRLR